ncbi:helix-turn-helix transcriptional regulator [Streptomyces hygroscopicus]|uniref:helix-turn-helix transcriptional regulator n=1 Tax=Streptomyces sp. KHY 26 TaxID=3097359 RepID=UPI002553CFC4|nr:helix-turn-helix transcriptional regulator [Streptomyces hygroscopicus]
MPTLHGKTVTDRAEEAGDRTHAQIARRLKLRQSTVSRLLTGTTAPSLKTLLAIKAAYGIPLDDLVADDARTPAKSRKQAAG